MVAAQDWRSVEQLAERRVSFDERWLGRFTAE
jgi:hypothetical protein